MRRETLHNPLKYCFILSKCISLYYLSQYEDIKICDHPPRRSYEERKQLWRTNTCGEPASSRHHLVIVDINGRGHKNQNNVRGGVVVEKSGGSRE